MTLRHVRLFALMPLLLAAQVQGAEVDKERHHQRNDYRGGKADCGCGDLVGGNLGRNRQSPNLGRQTEEGGNRPEGNEIYSSRFARAGRYDR